MYFLNIGKNRVLKRLKGTNKYKDIPEIYLRCLLHLPEIQDCKSSGRMYTASLNSFWEIKNDGLSLGTT